MPASMDLQVVVSPFLGVLFDNLTSLMHKQVGLLWGVDKEMKKLASTLSTVRAVLEDAEEKQVRNKAIANWLGKLKEAAYDVDDILDEWATEATLLELGSEHVTRTKRVCDSFVSCFSFEQVKFHRQIAKKINEVSETFNDIAAEKSNFHLTVGGVERKVELYPSRETSSIVKEPQIYGRDEDREYIVRLLLDNVSRQDDLSVCPILGIGGLGKTTVAQWIYNDERVKEHFEVNIWVCVSEDFDVKRLTRAVIASISEEASALEELDPLQCGLQEKLAGKRFLLVLDDVWNENQEEWNKFKYSLRGGAKGSSLLVTTRLKTVASITGTCPPYLLKLLSEGDCWSLFKQRAFGMGNEESPKLVKIGKEIVKKCGGVPLAAKVLGGLMRFKEEETQWLLVRDNNLWDLPESGENTILPALRLSYSHLSPQLRQCFAYCSIYPKDHEMEKEELVSLWMANGLLQSRDGIEFEESGNDIFHALLCKSFFEEVKSDDGNRRYVIHDLLHDLACSVNVNECWSVDDSSQIKNVCAHTRHLSVSFKDTTPSSIFQSIHQSAPKLRTLIVLSRGGKEFPTRFILSKLNCLRALRLQKLNNASLPYSIGNLRHLRYLDVSRSKITSLPESICRLRNLQTLKLEECSSLKKLPKYTGNMSSLRYLGIRGCYVLSEMPIGMGKLTCLQTLCTFVVGSDNGGHIKELHGLDRLSGKLTVMGLEHVRSCIEAKEAKMLRKQNLRALLLSWSHSRREEGREEGTDREVIEGLQPHPNIEELMIVWYRGLNFPSWLEVSSSLPNLVEITLLNCTRCERPPSLGRLPLLKTLSIRVMNSVKFFSGSDDDMVDGFPSLEKLDLYEMPELEEWCSLITGNNNNGGGEEQVIRLPCLKKLHISCCPKLKRLPLLLCLESLTLTKCNEMVLGSVKNLPRLSSLEIYSLIEVISFPEGMLQNLTALKSLSIKGCWKLQTLPKESGNLSSLESLKIIECHELKFLPEVGRSSLKELNIFDCRSLTDLSEGLRGCQTTLNTLKMDVCPKVDLSTVEFQHLIALGSLTLKGFPDLTALPDGLQHVSSTLKSLRIEDCSTLISLPDWIGSLTNLRDLFIGYCKNLTILPDGLQHLTGLQTLQIINCHPELHRRCEEGRGEDWQKISHIPRVQIRGRQ